MGSYGGQLNLSVCVVYVICTMYLTGLNTKQKTAFAVKHKACTVVCSIRTRPRRFGMTEDPFTMGKIGEGTEGKIKGFTEALRLSLKNNTSHSYKRQN